jgi:hypothetical protein
MKEHLRAGDSVRVMVDDRWVHGRFKSRVVDCGFDSMCAVLLDGSDQITRHWACDVQKLKWVGAGVYLPRKTVESLQRSYLYGSRARRRGSFPRDVWVTLRYRQMWRGMQTEGWICLPAWFLPWNRNGLAR